MFQVSPDIFSWSRFQEAKGYDFNGHLIVVPDGNLVVDPVEPAPEDAPRLLSRGVRRILLTNRNHTRWAKELKAKTGASIALHPADWSHAQEQGCPVDERLGVGQAIGPLRVIAVPGKSPGELAFHWPERRLLIVGDAVIGNPPGRLSLLREAVLDDPAALRQSVKALMALDFDSLLLGDGQSILQGAKAQLAALVAKL